MPWYWYKLAKYHSRLVNQEFVYKKSHAKIRLYIVGLILDVVEMQQTKKALKMLEKRKGSE